MPLSQPTIYASSAFDLPPPSAYLLPPALPYAHKAWSDSASTLVDPLALPPYPPTINTNLPQASSLMAPPPVATRMPAVAPAPSLPSESNDSYFPLIPSPGSPGSLRSAWSSSSGSSADSLDSLRLLTPSHPAPLFNSGFSLPPDPYQTFAPYAGAGAGADGAEAGASFYSLPPVAGAGLVDGLEGLAGLGLGYTPGGKGVGEQLQGQGWGVGESAWMGLMEGMGGSVWGAAV